MLDNPLFIKNASKNKINIEKNKLNEYFSIKKILEKNQ